MTEVVYHHLSSDVPHELCVQVRAQTEKQLQKTRRRTRASAYLDARRPRSHVRTAAQLDDVYGSVLDDTINGACAWPTTNTLSPVT